MGSRSCRPTHNVPAQAARTVARKLSISWCSRAACSASSLDELKTCEAAAPVCSAACATPEMFAVTSPVPIDA